MGCGISMVRKCLSYVPTHIVGQVAKSLITFLCQLDYCAPVCSSASTNEITNCPEQGRQVSITLSHMNKQYQYATSTLMVNVRKKAGFQYDKNYQEHLGLFLFFLSSYSSYYIISVEPDC